MDSVYQLNPFDILGHIPKDQDLVSDGDLRKRQGKLEKSCAGIRSRRDGLKAELRGCSVKVCMGLVLKGEKEIEMAPC